MLSITITEKNGSPQVRQFDQPEVSLGRVQGNDIVLPKSNISKRHCRFVQTSKGWSVQDNNSTNGTFVAGKRISTGYDLRPGDKVTVGDFTLELRAVAKASEASQRDRNRTRELAGPEADLEAGAGAGRSMSSTSIGAEGLDLPGGWDHGAGDALDDDAPVPNESRVLSRSRGSVGIGGAGELAAGIDAGALPEELSGIVQVVHERLARAFAADAAKTGEAAGGDLNARVDGTVRDIVREMARKGELPRSLEAAALVDTVLSEALGFGPLQELLDDPSITEILVNNARQIYVERGGKLEPTNLVFSSDQAVIGVIERIVAPLGRRIDSRVPMVDARLRDGSRVNAIIPPLAIRGPVLTIRKFTREPLQIDDLVAGGALNADMAEFLEMAVKMRKSIVVSGGTGAGKTTLLNVLSSFIDSTERIITIEDAAELNLEQQHVVSLESRPATLDGAERIGIRELMRNALRMRPDRIIVGECRGDEALDMLQAMNTGHEGSLTTVHANGPREALVRLETMVLMSGVELPMKAIRDQVAKAVDIVVQQSRFSDGSRRITHISEITGMESDVISMHDLFTYEQQGYGADGRVHGRFRPTGVIPKFYEELRARGVAPNLGLFREG